MAGRGAEGLMGSEALVRPQNPQSSHRRSKVMAVLAAGCGLAAVMLLVDNSPAHPSALSARPGRFAQEERQRMLKELAAVGSHTGSKLGDGIAVQSLSEAGWTNAGAKPDANVFQHGEDWKAPDDPAYPKPEDAPAKDMLGGAGPLVLHGTDNGSPGDEGFRIDRSADDLFHSQEIGEPTAYVPEAEPSSGNSINILTGVDSGAEGEDFSIDTSSDDFFTHANTEKTNS